MNTLIASITNHILIGVYWSYFHRIIWHASSKGVASLILELENAKENIWESYGKLKESNQKTRTC
jgi:hypothetical protein